jgi:hypothetical protein
VLCTSPAVLTGCGPAGVATPEWGNINPGPFGLKDLLKIYSILVLSTDISRTFERETALFVSPR